MIPQAFQAKKKRDLLLLLPKPIAEYNLCVNTRLRYFRSKIFPIHRIRQYCEYILMYRILKFS